MHPILFRIPVIHFPVFSYGLMLGLSLVVGWYIVLPLCERDGMDKEEMGKLYVWTAVFSMVGARLLYVFTNWPHFAMNPLDVFKVMDGGLVAYGGFLGGLLTGIVYCRIKGLRLLAWADCVVPSLGTGLMFTRIGCLLAGCDFGKPSDVAWAIRFPKTAAAYKEQLAAGLLDPTATQSLPVHPTQIYESLIGLTLFALTMLVRRYRKFSGQSFVAFAIGYGILRYFVETLRADSQRGEIGPFSTSQFIGLVTSALAAGFLVYLWRAYQKDPQGMRYWELAWKRGVVEPAVVAAPVKGKRRRRK